MSTEIPSDPQQHPHLGHLFLVGMLWARQSKQYPQSARQEAAREIDRYRNEALIVQIYGKETSMATKKTSRAHTPAPEPAIFSGKGIIYAVIDDRGEIPEGQVTTIDVITEAIENALDAGYETSEEIARFLTTSAFQHIPDKRLRFNSMLVAGDAVGAQMVRKLYNAYNELAVLVDEEPDPHKKAEIRAEATGFAEALNIMLSPFTCEDSDDPRLVNWGEVDRITAAWEKEQRFVIKERKGNPQ